MGDSNAITQFHQKNLKAIDSWTQRENYQMPHLLYRREITPEAFHVPVKIRPLSLYQGLSYRIRPVSR